MKSNAFYTEEIMNEEEKCSYSRYKREEFSSDQNTFYKTGADSSRKSYKKSNNSTCVNKRVSDHSLKYSDLSYVKIMSYGYKKLNAKLNSSEKENEVFHREQRRVQFALPTDEFNSNRLHSTKRIHVGQSSVIFNNQEIPRTSFFDDHLYSSTRFFDDRTLPSTSFSDNHTFASTSLSDNGIFSNNRTFSNTRFSNRCADPSTSFSNYCDIPGSSFCCYCADLSTSFLGIRAFSSNSRYDDQVRSKSFSDSEVDSRASFKKCYSMGKDVSAEKVPVNLDKPISITELFENLVLETSSDNDSVEVNVSDSSDYESVTEDSPPNVFKCKTPTVKSDSLVNKRNEKQKKKGKTLKSLSNLELLSPVQKLHAEGNSETVVTQSRKMEEELLDEDYKNYKKNRKRHISENRCHSLGTFGISYSFKKFKPL